VDPSPLGPCPVRGEPITAAVLALPGTPPTLPAPGPYPGRGERRVLRAHRDRERTVTFANGVVVRETIIGVNDAVRRLAYGGGRFARHNASFQVFSIGERQSRVLWVTDLLPDDLQVLIGHMVEQGIQAIKPRKTNRMLAVGNFVQLE
jgi:hypothetical protein